MIVNYEPKIIFFHVPRTGGTSIRKLFGVPLNDGDVIPNLPVLPWLLNRTGNYSAHDVKSALGKDFDSFSSFSVVRNPWDRVVSQYYFVRSRQQREASVSDFRSWVKRAYTPEPSSLYDWHFKDHYTGKMLVGSILRFESLVAEVAGFLASKGLDLGELPWLNKSDRGPYVDYYDDEARSLIASRASKDVAAYGYKFG